MLPPDREDDEFWKQAANVPDEFKLAIADLIISFGRLEIALDYLIWWAAGIQNGFVGRALTARLDVRPKCEMVLNILQEEHDENCRTRAALVEFQRINRNISTASKRRNAIVHGWWVAFGSHAVPMSHRHKDGGDPGFLAGAPISVDDIRNDTQLADQAERDIFKMISGPPPALQIRRD